MLVAQPAQSQPEHSAFAQKQVAPAQPLFAADPPDRRLNFSSLCRRAQVGGAQTVEKTGGLPELFGCETLPLQ